MRRDRYMQPQARRRALAASIQSPHKGASRASPLSRVPILPHPDRAQKLSLAVRGRAATGTLLARCERFLTGAQLSARIPTRAGSPYEHGRNGTPALGEALECDPQMHPCLT
jgi:hypothetical protein